MEQEMNWLTQLLDRLLCWIPRIWLVSPDEGGVRVTLGNRVHLTSSGWYVYWPLIQEMTKITVTPQVVDLRVQSVLTKDSRDMCFGGAIMYRIRDAQNALLKVQDYDKSLQTLALGIISRYISKVESIEQLNISQIEAEILEGVKKDARGWGLEIMRVYITDLGTTKNIRLLTDQSITGVQTYDYAAAGNSSGL